MKKYTRQYIRQKVDSFPRVKKDPSMFTTAFKLFCLYYDIQPDKPPQIISTCQLNFLAAYKPLENEILVADYSIHDGNKLLFVLFHELRHWWQFKIAGIAVVDSLSHNQYYMGDYMDCSARGVDYNQQAIEQDAHKSACELLEFYHLLHK